MKVGGLDLNLLDVYYVDQEGGGKKLMVRDYIIRSNNEEVGNSYSHSFAEAERMHRK